MKLRADKELSKDQFMRLLTMHPGLTTAQIVGRTGKTTATVGGMLRKLLKEGELFRKRDEMYGREWSYFPKVNNGFND